MPNQQVTELYKPFIKIFKRRQVNPSFKDNIWGAHFADMQLISKYNKGIGFLLCVIDFLVNRHGLFLYKIEKILLLLMDFKKC